jgi:hypothetical protein
MVGKVAQGCLAQPNVLRLLLWIMLNELGVSGKFGWTARIPYTGGLN